MGQELELIKDENKLKKILEKKILVYGAASAGRQLKFFLDKVKIPIQIFSDSDSNKWGEDIGSVQVISPNDMKTMVDENSVVIVASDKVCEIKKDLMEMGISEKQIYSCLAVLCSIYFHLESGIFKQDIVQECKEEYERQCKIREEWERSNLNLLDTGRFRQVMRESPIWIWQPGKVGSRSVLKSIKKSGTKACIHTHEINRYHKIYREGRLDIEFYLKHYYADNPMKIITMVREPISRGMSEFFFSLQPLIVRKSFQQEECPVRMEADLLNSCIHHLAYDTVEGNECCKCEGGNIDIPFIYVPCKHLKKYGNEFDWFDLEIKDCTGIDIFEYPFDKEKGYSIIRKKNIEILVLKSEKLNDLETVIAEFVEIHNFHLCNANFTSDTSSGEIYKEAKNEICVPDYLLDFYYENNPRVKHFYTDEECDKFRKRWEKNN